MAAPYLTEIRPGGDIKRRLRDITHEIADTFGVHGAVDPRPVPHVTLFGPYNTDHGHRAKDIVTDVLSDYDVVPYRIDGFGRFPQNNVIYANVVPSPELRAIRRALSRRLRPISYNYPDHDSAYFYDFHVTLAYKDVGEQFEDIWAYVNTEYELQLDTYATRVTSLSGREMMWEYDLLRGAELRSGEATSAASWERTMDLLSARQSPDDHERLSPTPNAVTRVVKSIIARVRQDW